MTKKYMIRCQEKEHIVGGRRNSKGIELIYTAKSRSLAMAGVAVHLTPEAIPEDYMIITIDIPDDIKSTQIAEADLPTDWKKIPNPTSTQKIGDDFVKENKYCVLIVPSAVIQGDYIVLINPCHEDFKKGKITITKTEKFQFDERIKH